MQEDPPHPQCIGDQAGMLARSAAEAVQCVVRYVVSALHGDFLDRIGHVLDCNAEKALCNGFRRVLGILRRGYLRRQRFKQVVNDVGIQRLFAFRAEDSGKVPRLDPAQHDIAVGDSQGPAPSVTRRAGVCASRVRADPKTRAIECEDRSAAGGDGVYVHHGRTHPHAGDQGLKAALKFAVEMGNVS